MAVELNVNDDFPNGPPHESVEIDPPDIDRCRAYTSHLYHPNGRIVNDGDGIVLTARIVVPYASTTPDVSARYGYWLVRSIREAIYGEVFEGRLLKRKETEDESAVEWTVTNTQVAIKMLNLHRLMERIDRQGGENPFDEISVMQTLQRHIEAGIQGVDMVNGDIEEIMAAKEAALRDNRIMALFDALTDDTSLFSVMPFCDGGELFDVVDEHIETHGSYSEQETRYWFRQMLTAIEVLQQNELCHRDISLENMMTTSDGLSIVIDFGMCLKVPYIEENGVRRRCLITLDNNNWGKPYYKAPELVANEPFDGFAVDVWALGPILFIMNFGFPPWDNARDTDQQFQAFSNGHLGLVLNSWNLNASDELVDLLQGMFWRDPRRRLSLSQVREHAWVNGPVARPPAQM